MSYQVLARKWRPAQFQEMVGQEHVLKALVNALDDDRLHHAYLFTGTRGVGKTSIARLFAKSLNCETGVSSTPCGECSACREISEGRFVDLIEVDAASRTKVEDTRDLLENVQYAPTHGRFKVYLIDEVHMLSTHSFNALLKTLEEPPPHVKFLLATTDPQKLPMTILSRCLQFNLKNMIPERIVDHLSHVLNAENISFEEPALWLLARSADGSMRDAMSLTDQAIAFGAGEVNEADVRSMLGTIDQRLVYRLVETLSVHDAKALLTAVEDLSRFSPDYNTVLGDLISLLHRIALAQVVPDAVDNGMGDREQVLQLASQLTAEDVQLFYQIALMGRKDLPFVPDAREGLEMILLRMLAFRPASVKASIPSERPVNTGSVNTGSVDTGTVAPESQAESSATVQSRQVSELSDLQHQQSDPTAGVQNASVLPVIEPQQPVIESQVPVIESQVPVQAPVVEASIEPVVETRVEPVIESVVEPVLVPPVQAAAQSEQVPDYSAPADMSSVPDGYDESYVPSDNFSRRADPVKKFESEGGLPVEVASPAVSGANVETMPWDDPVAVEEFTPQAAVQQDSAVVSSSVSNAVSAPLTVQPEVIRAKPADVIQAGPTDVIQAEPDRQSVKGFAELKPEHWVLLIDQLGLSGMTYSIAANTSLELISEDLLQFHYATEQKALLNDTHIERIRSAIGDYLNHGIEVKFILGEFTRETPSQYRARKKAERQRLAVQSIETDPVVQTIIERFNGYIDLDSVEPID
ncbi:MAG: DNA polymerase III subunit gamma/tau [Amphritea sp.]